MGNQIITLNVDTAKIKSSNVDGCCNFGQSAGVSNKDFTIQAKVGDTITWKGHSTSSPTDIVNITAIKHEGGENIFAKNELPGVGSVNEQVIGSVIKKTPEGKDYKYQISFTVFNNGVKRPGSPFHIDPKIQVH